MTEIEGVIFDMDGVLCDSEPFICEAARLMLSRHYGIEAKPEEFEPFVGMGEDRYLGGVAEKYGVSLEQPRDKERTYALYLELIRGRLHPLPGVHEFIDHCRKQRLRCALATSADRIKMEGNLREIGLPPDRFDARVHGGDAARRKPHPDLFELAARRMQVDPARCLVVEDAPAGLRAARAAGAEALGITSSFPAEVLRAAGAAWTASDLAAALRLQALPIRGIGSGSFAISP